MMIRFIWTVYGSKRDVNGNCYYFSHLRSTKTGKAIAWHTHSHSNARAELAKALGVTYLDWDTLHYAEHTVGYRELGRLAKVHDASYSNPTAADIAELES